MPKAPSKLPRTVTIFTLAMINVAAIGSIKNWPVTAEYGFASIFYFLLATLIFFIPVSLVSAELATGWPQAGGVFAWVKQAFGHRTGFLAIWLLWVQNLFWYPTILSFIGATIAYIFNPDLANNTIYTVCMILITFWGATIANLIGMRTSGWISAVGVVLGTFVPGAFMIILGVIWYTTGQPLQITFSWDSLIPNMSSLEHQVFFSGVILSLIGMEMSAVHAKDVMHPKRDYPRAILLSAAIIIGSSILGVLAIACVIPQKEISLVSGTLQAFSYFTKAYKIEWITPVIALLMAIGAIGSLSTWILGPAKGLLAAAQYGDLPPFFRAINRHGMPKRLLLCQGVIVTLICLIYVWMPTVSAAFWILSAVVTQLYLIMYLLMFATVIKLRSTMPKHERPYHIPGGKIGLWITGLLGICSSIYAMIIAFFPPSQIETGSKTLYIAFVALATAIFTCGPFLILLFQKPSWKKQLEHEKK
ncbi:MAG: amino acid permease [Verrucomicrobia bacterium]|nr:amino acid permease [Verrucomicrobiota bacterium]